ncbi:MAG: hypothetical protein J5613_00790 [Alphaproteobacteria bacterium]|nr:hypothetical protein [Alphaproteobacteria bacterium]
MRKFIILGCTIFVASCTQNTLLPNNVCPCNAIYGYASDWDVISDDLARNIYRHNLMCENMRNDYSL